MRAGARWPRRGRRSSAAREAARDETRRARRPASSMRGSRPGPARARRAQQLIVRGQANLIGSLRAEEDLERIRLLFADLETQTDVIDLLHRAENGEGVKIFIGSENKLFSLSGSSMIAAPLRVGDRRDRRRARRHRPDAAQLRAHRADGRICRAGARRTHGAGVVSEALSATNLSRQARGDAHDACRSGPAPHNLGAADRKVARPMGRRSSRSALLLIAARRCSRWSSPSPRPWRW